MGDVINGKKLFTKMCATCHTIKKDGKYKAGPNLYGIMGKTCGTISFTLIATPGFNFSENMKGKAIMWDKNTLNKYLKLPKKFILGTTKSFFGIKKAQERKDLIAFLATLK